MLVDSTKLVAYTILVYYVLCIILYYIYENIYCEKRYDMHRRKLLKKTLAAFLAVNLIVTSSSMVFAGNDDRVSVDAGNTGRMTSADSHYGATGYRELDEEYQIIPDVLDNNNSNVDGIEITKAAAYPATYKTSALPAIRDQGVYGVCWSFSTISLIETNLIKKNLASKDIDLSELHLVNYTYNCVNDPLGGLEGDINKYDTSYGSVMQYGGNVEMAANSLLDWEGAVNEDVVPYTTEYIRKVENGQLDDSLAYGNDVAHVQNFYRINTTSREDVKKAVMDYGAVSITYWSDQSTDWSTDYYNSSTAAYYCPSAYATNHAVTVVGWDDNYSADNFATRPAGNGAWIVRNSWGSSYGDDGYFYLSYYDKSIYTVGYALEAELSDNYDNNYQYDGAMLYGYMGYTDSNKYANVFEAKANQNGNESIKAVSFMTGGSTNLNYTVSVYTNLTDASNPESGTLAAKKSGLTTYDGTYTVSLDNAVKIEDGKKFSVVVEVKSNSGGTSYLSYERSMQQGKAGYWCTASAKENQSFIADPYGDWDDFGKAQSCNFIIKAFTDNEIQTPVVEVESVSLDKSEMTLTEGEAGTLVATVTPDNAVNKSVTWGSSNSTVATVSEDGAVTAKSAGTAVITATTENGKTAGCTVTVNKKDTYTGLRDVDGNWLYFENGKVNNDYTGLVNYEGMWFYVSGGTIDWGYTGLADYNGIWFYVSGGILDWNYTGLTYYNDVWFYVSGGTIGWDYTGLVYYNDIWFYVSGGILNWDYIGLTDYNDIWFMISGGMINWDYAGLVYYNDMWFYVSGGTINWDYAGLIYYNDAWFYVSGGTINWTTAIVDYNGAKFYVQNGMVDWDYTGTVDYNGNTYNVISGIVY